MRLATVLLVHPTEKILCVCGLVPFQLLWISIHALQGRYNDLLAWFYQRSESEARAGVGLIARTVTHAAE